MVRRTGAAALVVFALLATFGVAGAAADPVRSPRALVFDTTCPGGTFQVVATGAAGHLLESSSVGILLAGEITVFVNGVLVDQDTFALRGKPPTVSGCSAVAEFQDPEGNTIRIEISNAEILVTPPKR